SMPFAMSCLRANPLTGEMIDGDVIFDASWIRYWKEEYAFLTGTPPTTGRASEPPMPLAVGQVISPMMAAKSGFGLALPVPARNPRLNARLEGHAAPEAVPAEWTPLQMQLRKRQLSGQFSACQYSLGMRPQMSLAAIALANAVTDDDEDEDKDNANDN